MKNRSPTVRRLRWLVRATCLLAAAILLVPLLPGSSWPVVLPSLSPFVATAAVLATWTLPAVAWLGLIVGLVAVLRHRWFCRWVCPTGLCTDGASRIGSRLGRPRGRLPAVGQWIAALTLGGALVGYPLLLWLDPLGMAASLFRLGGPVDEPVVWFSVLSLPAVLLVSLWWPNLWCGQICPLGGLQDLLAFIPRLGSLFRRDRDPGRPRAGGRRVARRTVLGAALGSGWALAAGVLRGTPPLRLRPPGAAGEPEFLGLCIRCGNCARACPTGIIGSDTGDVAGFLTPILRFRDGYCREDCTRCTEVCPSGALVRVSLEEKPQVRIGVPRVDMDVCLLGDDRDCAACRNHCPYEAVRYVFCEVDYTLVPQIDEDRCNGCGACEHACPTRPVKALVVLPTLPFPKVFVSDRIADSGTRIWSRPSVTGFNIGDRPIREVLTS